MDCASHVAFVLPDISAVTQRSQDYFEDDHTAKAILRGGTAYAPEPMRWDAGCGIKNDPIDENGRRTIKHTKGNWYFPQA